MVSCVREASPWSVLGGVVAVLVQVVDGAGAGVGLVGSPANGASPLRAQGLRGNRYRFLWGDLKEESRLTVAALARPVHMDRPHHVLPRVSPLLHRVADEHGKLSFTWLGTTPRVTITDPQLAREVMSNKDGYFVKTKLAKRVMKFLIGGIGILDAEKWVKHRRILNLAFHAEKLKGMLPAFSAACSDLICRWDNLVADSVGTEEVENWKYGLSSKIYQGMSYQELFSVLATKKADEFSDFMLNKLYALLRLSRQVTSRDFRTVSII